MSLPGTLSTNDLYIDGVIASTSNPKPESIDVHLADPDTDEGGPWLTVRKMDWPAAYWPPQKGDIVSVRQPVATLRLRPRVQVGGKVK